MKLTPPPDTCQLTAMYLPPAVTRSVSHAEPEIFAFSYDTFAFSPYTWRYLDCVKSASVSEIGPSVPALRIVGLKGTAHRSDEAGHGRPRIN